MSDWDKDLSQIEAAKTLKVVGSPRLGDAIILRNLRQNKSKPDFILAGISSFENRRGSWNAWQFVQSCRELIDSEDDELLREWHRRRAALLIKLKDYESAKQEIKKAEDRGIKPIEALFLRSDLFEASDKPESAREILSEAESLGTEQIRVHLRQAELEYTLHHIDKTLEIYRGLSELCEDRHITHRYARILLEHEYFDEASNAVSRLDKLTALPESLVLEYQTPLKAELSFELGKVEDSLKFAEAAKLPYWDIWMRNVKSAPPDAKRRVLDVPFIKQAHLNCVPASISSISAYFGHPIDQNEIARDLTYDGTRDSTERAWLEARGWTVREFLVDWDTTRRLIDLGLPFALTTRDLYASHMQVIMGYDHRQGTYLIREPGSPLKSEWLARESEKRYQTNGMRGLLILPPDHLNNYEEIVLPEEESYAITFKFHQFLIQHDPAAATQELEKLGKLGESERLIALARLRLAQYNQDTESQQNAIASILEQFPEDPYYVHLSAYCLRNLGRETECRSVLRNIIQNAEKKSPPPHHIHLLLAEYLVKDFRYSGELRRLLRHVQNVTYHNSNTFWILSNHYLNLEDFETAKQCARFSSTLSYYNEFYAENYYIKARRCGNPSEGISYLINRTRQLGDRSGQSWCTLAQAYIDLSQHQTALITIEDGLKKLGADEHLLEKAISTFYGNGQIDRAKELLQESKPHLKSTDWLEECANIHTYEGELHKALENWYDILKQLPDNRRAIESIASLIERIEGPEAKRGFFEKQLDRNPHNYLLTIDFLENSRDDRQRQFEAIQNALKIFPDNAWVYREAAICASILKRFEESRKFINIATQIEPYGAINYQINARIEFDQGNTQEAFTLSEKALKLDIDSEESIEIILESSESMERRIEACRFIAQEIRTQVNYGSGIQAFSKRIIYILPLNEAQSLIEELNQARPDLWQTWQAHVDLYLNINQPKQALEIAISAFERFPFVGPIGYSLFQCYEALHQSEEAINVLNLTCQRSPHYSYGVREYAEQLWNHQQKDAAYELLSRERRKNPLNEYTLGVLGYLYNEDGNTPLAYENLKQAISYNPGYTWARDTLLNIAIRLKQEEELLQWTRELIVQKPLDLNAQICLISYLYSVSQNEDSLQACNEAIERFGAKYDLIDWKAFLLSKLKRYDEAVLCTQIPDLPFGQSMTLSIRRATIENERGNRKKSIELFEEHTKSSPNDYRAWKNLASLYSIEQNYENSVRSAKEMVRINPLNDLGYWYYANGLKEMGQFAEARNALKTSLKINIDSADNLNLLIDSCEDQETYERAFSFLESEIIKQVNKGDAILEFAKRAPRIIASDDLLQKLKKVNAARPDLWQSWAALILEYQRQHNFSEFPRLMDECVELHAHVPRIHQINAEIHDSLGETDLSIDALKTAIDLSPKYYYAKRELVDRLLTRGRLDEALELAEELVAVEPDVSANHGFLSMALLRTERKEEGFQALFQAVKISPDYHWARNELAEHFQKEDRYRELIDFFEKEFDADSESHDKAVNLAYIYRRAKFWNEALHYISIALELSPRNVGTREIKAYYLTELGRYDEAIECCEYGNINFEQSDRLRMRIGLIQQESERLDDAIVTFRKILKTDPLNTDAAEYLTECIDKSSYAPSQYYDAAKHWTQIAPNRAVAFGYLADACLKAKRKDEAKEALKIAFKLDPEYSFAATRYFNACIEDSKTDEAIEIIDKIRSISKSNDYAYYEVLLYCHVKKYEDAWNSYLDLIRDSENSWIGNAASKIRDCAGESFFEKRSRKLLQDGTMQSRDAARNWATSSIASSGVIFTIIHLRKFSTNNEATLAAHIELMEHCGGNKAKIASKYLCRFAVKMHQ
ncbi:MAG: tetratricopeptide repeat protein [Opitutales bacterium]